MATKHDKRQARGLIEALESRIHRGPPVHHSEIESARDFLAHHNFPASSDYFIRLMQVRDRLQLRTNEPRLPSGKRNYGGEAGGIWMQVQVVFDHLILSTCYSGEHHSKRGRVKISHRFNEAGRVDFVELKFLRALHPAINGELRKLILVKDFQAIRKDWQAAEAFVLPALPLELIFLYQDIFRCAKEDLFAWLLNIGHRILKDALVEIREAKRAPAHHTNGKSHELHWQLIDGNGAHGEGQDSNGGTEESSRRVEQQSLSELLEDEIGLPILEKVAALESSVEIQDAKTVLVRYHRTVI